MKLTKDQTQKIVLGGMMLCGLIYSYFEFGLAPLTVTRENANKGIKTIDPQIEDAKAQIARTKALEAKEPAARLLLDQVKAMIPDGSAIAWFPPKVTEMFKREGVDKVGVRMVNEVPEKELAGFSRITWAADIPRADFLTLAGAVSVLENTEPLLEIHGFEIEAGRDDVQNQRITLSVVNLIRL